VTGLLLEGALLPGAPTAVDVLVDDGIVAEIVPHGAPSARVPRGRHASHHMPETNTSSHE